MDATQRNKDMTAINMAIKENQTVISLPEQYGIEYMVAENENPHSWVTYVRCQGKKGGDQLAIFSCSKIASGIDLYRTTGLPFVVMAAWDDAICSLRIWNTDTMQLQLHPHGDAVYILPHQHFAVRYLKKYA
jgi:hypothetical protein